MANSRLLGAAAALFILAGCGSTSTAAVAETAVTTAAPTTTTAVLQDDDVVAASPVPNLAADPEQEQTSTTPTSTSPTTTLTVTSSSSTSSSSTSAPLATTSTSSSTTSTSTSTTTAPPPSATLVPQPGAPAFASSISIITDAIAERMTHSWREGCPIGLDELRLLTLSHWNYDGKVSTGELVVRSDFAEPMVTVFERLYDARFPIQQMELVDVYAGDDDSSMAANNTSAFNCREVAWKPGVWSNHALGTAIDINPLVNPYVSTTRILPPGGEAFADRSTEALGGLYPGDVATQAFADIGWVWGGTWDSAKDWQHFSASGG